MLETIVYIADTICARNHKGFSLTAEHQILDPAVLDAAGISPAIIEKTQANLDKVIEAATVALG